MKLLCSISLFLALAACGGGSKSSGGGGTGPDTTGGGGGEETAVAAKTCADVGSNMEAAMRKDGAPDDVINLVVPIGVTSCTEDAWSQEAIDCFATAEDGATCEPMLTEDQKMGIQTRAEAAMGGGGGGEEGGME